MEELDKKISEIVRSTVKEIWEPGTERSTISKCLETARMSSRQPYLIDIRGMSG